MKEFFKSGKIKVLLSLLLVLIMLAVLMRSADNNPVSTL